MREVDGEWAAELERLRGEIAGQEPKLASAIEAYNAAIRAAQDSFFAATGGYQDLVRQAHTLHFKLEYRIQEAAEEAAGGDAGEARRVGDWLEAWREAWDAYDGIGVSRPDPVKVPDPPLSGILAALPRSPGDVVRPPVRPVDPGVLSSVRDSWRRIDAWLVANAPALAAGMNAAATPEAIAKAEAAMGLEMPDAVRASYLVHDGSRIFGLLPAGEHVALKEMLSIHEMWKGMDEEFRADGTGDVNPKGPIRRVHYHLGWFPLTHDGGGGYTLIDTAPADGGAVGQLIDFDRDEGPQRVAAAGLAEYLAYLADGLEAGAATVVEDSHLEWNSDRDTPRSGYVLPPDSPGPAAATRPAASAGTFRRCFEFKEGASNKFWEVSVEGAEMATRWGKIGTKGQSKAKSFGSPGEAAAEAAKLAAKKLGEGYAETTP